MPPLQWPTIAAPRTCNLVLRQCNQHLLQGRDQPCPLRQPRDIGCEARVGGQFLQSLGLERYLAAFRDKLWRRVSVCLSLRQTDLPQSLGDAIEHRGRMDKRSHDL
jgi:hypothetical protein